MRIKVNFTKNTQAVPNNNKVVLEYLHRCLGRDNKYHDKASQYNVSHLYGGQINPSDVTTLNFPNGGYFIVSSLDKEFMGKLLMGLLDNPVISYGMQFSNIQHINETFLNGWNHFAVLSPFIIKGNYGKNDYSFFTLDGEYKRTDAKWAIEQKQGYNFETVVRDYLINKLKKIDEALDLADFTVKIDELDQNKVKHNKHKVKKVYVKNVLNYANQCQLSIHCKKSVAELLYNIGIGQSTGAGFGTIYNTQNHHLYRATKTTKQKVEIKKTELLSEVA